MQTNKEKILEILSGEARVRYTHEGKAEWCVSTDDFVDVAEQILSELQGSIELQPQLPQADGSGNEVAVCPRCKVEHVYADCHGYCSAACLQEDEGQTDR